MFNMSQINNIRDLAAMGYSISKIHELTGADPKTIRKYLRQEDFSPSPGTNAGHPTILEPYEETIRSWLESDQNHWHKQKHTAKRIYDRLVAEKGYSGSYETVQKYVKGVRRSLQTKATQELIWEPGSAQVDFGEADFIVRTICQREHYLVLSLPFSNDGYAQVFKGETAECVCQGLQDIFEHIGGVPRIIVFDNATGIGHRIKEKVVETELFARFRAHYGFVARFCNPYAGHEKGNVENMVGAIRRNMLVPAPEFSDFAEYNKQLLKTHLEKSSTEHYKKKKQIAELFEEDKKHFLPLPAKKFNVCRYEEYKADGYGKICLDGCHFYSTKPENHGKIVRIGIRAHYIDILNEDGSILVRHEREYGSERTDSCDYSTSLDVLAHNIGAWGNSGTRQDASELLRNYIDEQPKDKQCAMISALRDLSKKIGYQKALETLDQAVRLNKTEKSDLMVLGERVGGYGLNTPPSAGPPLAIYDEMFLPSGEEGRAS